MSREFMVIKLKHKNYIEYTIEDVNIGSITQVNESGISREDMPMQNSTQLDYNIIDEYKDFLQNNGT